jgi:presenilin-like A22 family membrane protease
VVLVAISATVFYLLIKRRSKRIIKGLIVVAMTTAALLLSVVYLNAILNYFPSLDTLTVLIVLSVAITVLFDLAIFRLGSIPRNVAVVCIGGALGIFFGFSIPLYSAVLILAFLAVYDVFAVYRGPVGKIAQSSAGMDQLQGLSFSFKDIQMGLGDLVFYSMLTGAMFFSFLPSILPTIAAIVGITAGSIITFYMLEKKGIFPGLPFPIMLGLAGGLITGLLILPLL